MCNHLQKNQTWLFFNYFFFIRKYEIKFDHIVVYSAVFYEQRGTHIYKNISLILFSKGAHSLLLVWEIDGETYTQRGDFFLSHVCFLEPGGANPCTPLQAVSSETPKTPLIGCLSLARLPILWTLSKSDHMVLVSRGLLPVTQLLDRPAPTYCLPPFTNHNVTACQSTRGH